MAWKTSYVAGAYGVTWNSIDIGYTEGGFELAVEIADPVPVVSDRYGSVQLDGILQGIERMLVRVEALEFDSTKFPALLPMLTSLASGLQNVTAGTLIARGSLAKPLVLTPKTGGAVAVGKTWTFINAYSLESPTLMFSSKQLRKMNYGFQIFPNFVATAGLTDDDTLEPLWYTTA